MIQRISGIIAESLLVTRAELHSTVLAELGSWGLMGIDYLRYVNQAAIVGYILYSR